MGTTTTPPVDTSPSPMASTISEYGRIAVSVLVIIAFGVCMYLTYFEKDTPLANSQLFSTFASTINTLVAAVVYYWLGSSFDSSKKTNILASTITQQPPPVVLNNITPTPPVQTRTP